LKFNRSGGKITLRVEEKDKSLVFGIQDEGYGILKKDQARIFKPYHRLDIDREHFNGLGLGLALSKTLVELHQGQIWLTSRNGKGCTFYFSIPLMVTAQSETGQENG
jgi:signal transduction histidine kinase